MTRGPDIGAIQRAIAAGQQDQFEIIVQTYEKPLYNFIANRVRDASLAEDLSQEAFLKAYRALDDFDGARSSFRTWLYRIGLNVCLDHFRRQRTRELGQRALEQEAHTRPEAVTPLDRIAKRDQLFRLLERLDGEDAEILMMRYLDGLEYDEISDLTGLGATTLRSRVCRCLRKLQSRGGSDRGQQEAPLHAL